MIDLKTLAHGLRWRVTLDPSDAQSPRSERPWMYRVGGRKGHVYVQGTDQLAVWCDTKRTARLVLALPGTRLTHDGDRESVIIFPTAQLDAVCEVIKAKRRRVLTSEQRARLAEAGAKGMAKINAARLGRSDDGILPSA